LNQQSNILKEVIRIKVRFYEVDPLGIMWHGHYLKYFEDGREAFGEKYGISYLDIYNNGYVTPLISINCKYLKPLNYQDIILVETSFINVEAAKIYFKYRILSENYKTVYTEGESIQVFLNKESRALQLTHPDFFIDWKKKNGIY